MKSCSDPSADADPLELHILTSTPSAVGSKTSFLPAKLLRKNIKLYDLHPFQSEPAGPRDTQFWMKSPLHQRDP